MRCAPEAAFAGSPCRSGLQDYLTLDHLIVGTRPLATPLIAPVRRVAATTQPLFSLESRVAPEHGAGISATLTRRGPRRMSWLKRGKGDSMRRIAIALATVVALCLLRVPDVFAGGGFGVPPPDKTRGPAVKVSIVMEGPPVPLPSEAEPRQFAMTV